MHPNGSRTDVHFHVVTTSRLTQFADGGDELKIWRVNANIRNE
jgi:hypothetical protein